jgi:hypothetical protein
MDINPIANAVEQLTRILALSAEQYNGIAEKLVRANIEMSIPVDKPDTMGRVIDLYA